MQFLSPREKETNRKKTNKKQQFFAVHLFNDYPRFQAFIGKCLTFIEKYGKRQEGIFRLCGSKPDIDALKEEVTEDPDNFQFPEDDKSMSVHNVTGLLKLFLKELPDSIMTFELYFAFIAASAAPAEARIQTIQTVVNLMPIENLAILERICKFMHELSKYKEDNKMSATNLATCIGFILLRPEVDDPQTIISDANLACELFKSLIEDPDTFFSGEFDLDPPEVENETLLSKNTPELQGLHLSAEANPTTSSLSSSAASTNPCLSSLSSSTPISMISTSSSLSSSAKVPTTSLPSSEHTRTTSLQDEPNLKRPGLPNTIPENDPPPLPPFGATTTSQQQISNPVTIPNSNSTPGIIRERCSGCNKFIFGVDRQISSGKAYHHACLQKLKDPSLSLQPLRPLPEPPTPEKIQQVKNKFLQQYEIHRSQSSVKIDALKHVSNMNEEQFRQNLANLVTKMQNGEIESHEIGIKSEEKDIDAQHDKNLVNIVVNGLTKKEKTSSRNKNEKPEASERRREKVISEKAGGKFDPSPILPPISITGTTISTTTITITTTASSTPSCTAGTYLAPKSNRPRKMTLENFGKRTSEQMERFFQRKTTVPPIATLDIQATSTTGTTTTTKEKRGSRIQTQKFERGEKTDRSAEREKGVAGGGGGGEKTDRSERAEKLKIELEKEMAGKLEKRFEIVEEEKGN